MLISFEGIDGCGKSTQIRLLNKYLSEKGYSVHIFREPGGTDISEQIRNLLLHDSDEMNPVTELLLFSAARSQLISEKVKPVLERGDIVILDRFYDSTTAYQGYGRKSAPLKDIEHLNSIASHHVVPEITFYLRIDPETAAERTQNTEKDRMERAGFDFFKQVTAGFDEMSRSDDRFIVIDATKSMDTIRNQVLSAVESRLKL